jgi:hypothetical protein
VPSDVQERRDDQLRKLIQAGVPLVIIPPVCEAIVGFELEMIRSDVKGIIVPAWGAPLHEAIHDLLDWHDSHAAAPSPLGRTEMFSIERSLAVRSRAAVLAAFAHDAEILRRVAGPFKRLTASGGVNDGQAKPSLANLSVHAEGDVPIRWSVAAPGGGSGAELTELGSTGRITFSMPSAAPWRLSGPDLDRSYEPQDGVATVLDELQKCIANASLPRITWLHACRAVEAMEAIDRSMARNRAIDLYNEEHSEESSFKGIMAASGCLMLLGTLAAISCTGALAVFFPPGKRTGDVDPAQYGQFHSYWTWLQVCLIAPLAVFLLIQLLSFGLSRHLRSKRQSQPAAKIAD